jgi:hypothetical protein
MTPEDSFVMGTVYYFGDMADLARILAEASFAVQIGQWSLRIHQCARAFKLEYVGNLSPDAPFNVDGDGYDFPVAVLTANCERLAECLRRNRIGFDFTHFAGDQERELGAYQFRP